MKTHQPPLDPCEKPCPDSICKGIILDNDGECSHCGILYRFADALRAPEPTHPPTLGAVLAHKAAAPARPNRRPITLDRIMEACESDDYLGFCTNCGDTAYGVEPDARGYTCESCDSPQVFGAEEIALTGGIR